MRKPLIGITPYHIKRKNSFWNATKEEYYLSVWGSGACPVTLNHPPNKEEIPNIVNQIDAFLMVGGPDIPAGVYGSENPNLIDKDQMSKERESFDRLVFLETMKQNKKVLAICLGAQHVNVVLGGTLTEDIPTLIPDAIDHGKFNGKHSIHSDRVNKESLLLDILGLKFYFLHQHHVGGIHQMNLGIKPILTKYDHFQTSHPAYIDLKLDQ